MRKRRGRRGERGAVLVEFVFILPVFLLLLFGGLDMALTVNGMGSFRSGVEQGVTFIQQGDTEPSTDNCVATLMATTPPATQATAEALCEVNDSINSVTGVDLSTLQEAVVCEDQYGGLLDCTQNPPPAKFVVCVRAHAQSVTGLTSPLLNNIWVNAVSSGTLTGTASTTWNSPSYSTSAALDCPPAPAYTVTFNPNGAAGTMPPQTASGSTPLTPNAYTYLGFTFTGWNTALNGSGTNYADQATYGFDAANPSVTLYAQWSVNPTYTVHFDPNGGTGGPMPDESANYPTALNPNLFTPPTGFNTFTGWNTMADGSGTPYGPGATYPFTADATLYAQWGP